MDYHDARDTHQRKRIMQAIDGFLDEAVSLKELHSTLAFLHNNFDNPSEAWLIAYDQAPLLFELQIIDNHTARTPQAINTCHTLRDAATQMRED